MALALRLMMARSGVADHTKRRFRLHLPSLSVAEGAVLRAVEEVVSAVVGGAATEMSIVICNRVGSHGPRQILPMA